MKNNKICKEFSRSSPDIEIDMFDLKTLLISKIRDQINFSNTKQIEELDKKIESNMYNIPSIDISQKILFGKNIKD